MEFTADHYFHASVERMSQAQHLYREGTGYYALTMYVAGLAVECLLRAFLLRRKRDFEARHDLLLLFKESGILDVDPGRLKTKGLSDEQIEAHEKALRASVNDVFILWRNNYRFASEARLLAPPTEDEVVPRSEGRPAQGESTRSPQGGPAVHR
jgi:hypothetical protein